jgi:hypothetical protein
MAVQLDNADEHGTHVLLKYMALKFVFKCVYRLEADLSPERGSRSIDWTQLSRPLS